MNPFGEVLADGGNVAHRDRHLVAFEAWRDALQPTDVSLVLERLPEIAPLGVVTRHKVGQASLSFVKSWAQLCRAPAALLHDSRPSRLVCDREIALKAGAGTSRIRSSKVRARWNGESGGIIEYRWPVARQCLNDLADAR